jgi:hypothetical protein
MLSEGPNATERKADLLTFKARFDRLSGAVCLLFHFTQVDRALLEQFHPEWYSERHPDGRIILSNFFRLAGFPAPRSEAAALARA